MGYTVRLFNPVDDKEGLLRLWNEAVQNPSAARYEAMYAENAFNRIVTWLLFYDTQANPVGCLSLLSHRFNISGQEVLCGINCDIVVTKRHRTLGPAVILLESLMRECQSYGFKALLAMPNNMSRPIFIRAGYKQFGAVYRWSKILKTEEKLKVKIKNYFLRKVIAILANFFLKWALCGGIQWFYGYLGRKLKVINVPLNQFRLDYNIEDGYGIECSSAYLQWRFGRVGSNESQVFSLYRGDALFGFIVYFLQRQEAIVEYMFISPSENMNILLSGFIDKMRQLRIEVISIAYFSAGRLQKNFRQMGFLQRDSREVFLYTVNKDLNDAFSGLIKDWSLFESDLDL